MGVKNFIIKTKQDYYNKLHDRQAADNKTFWKFIKPLFTVKNSNFNKKRRVEKSLILEENDDFAESFINFSTSVVLKLNISRYQNLFIDNAQTEQYKNHHSAIVVNNQNMDRRFSFQETTKSEINQENLNLDSSKACEQSDLPSKIIKANSDIFTEVLHKELHKNLEIGTFSYIMKVANVTPVYKKGSRSEEGNY